MPTRNQHFVPRVYLKKWSKTNNDTVLYYKNTNLNDALPRNVKKICFERHTYTINYDVYFVLDYMPKVQDDYGQKIKKVLNENLVDAFYNGKHLDTARLLASSENLGNLDMWEFFYRCDENKIASKKKIISLVKGVRSYVLEDAFDEFMETKWNGILDKFISDIERGLAKRITNEDIEVNKENISSLINTLLLLMCRNPKFDYRGVLTDVKNILLDTFLTDENNTGDREGIKQIVDDQMRGAWLSQIYKSLFNNDLSFCKKYMESIREKCQVSILKCANKDGSFITSDNPAFFYVNSAERLNKNAIYFPLTPEYLLLIGSGSANSLHMVDVKNLTNISVRIYNRIIFSNSNDGIISNSRFLGFIL